LHIKHYTFNLIKKKELTKVITYKRQFVVVFRNMELLAIYTAMQHVPIVYLRTCKHAKTYAADYSSMDHICFDYHT